MTCLEHCFIEASQLKEVNQAFIILIIHFIIDGIMTLMDDSGAGNPHPHRSPGPHWEKILIPNGKGMGIRMGMGMGIKINPQVGTGTGTSGHFHSPSPGFPVTYDEGKTSSFPQISVYQFKITYDPFIYEYETKAI